MCNLLTPNGKEKIVKNKKIYSNPINCVVSLTLQPAQPQVYQGLMDLRLGWFDTPDCHRL